MAVQERNMLQGRQETTKTANQAQPVPALESSAERIHMTKFYRYDCPACGVTHDLPLHGWFDATEQSRWECEDCGAELYMGPSRPRTFYGSRCIVNALFVVIAACNHWSFASLVFTAPPCMVIMWILGRTLGKPQVKRAIPESDFLKEELQG
jgi:predicted RNA-binding Zn-ribbon protein involved in translation (DUF1610 family)